MHNLDKSLKALENLMNQLSDENLDRLIGEIDAKGITGPSVDEYFGNLNNSIGSFLSDPIYSVNPEMLEPVNSVACAGEAVERSVSFADLTVLDQNQNVLITNADSPYSGYILAGDLLNHYAKVVAAENTYAMAA